MPKSLDPTNCSPEDCVPCLFLPYSSARFLVFYVHSNAEDIGRCHAFCSSVRAQFQVHVLAVEYPGYGICPGAPCNEQSVTENAFVAFRFVREVLSWPLDSILIMGRSIGCGPAISLAVRYQVSGVIIVCPMLSVKDLVKDVAGPLSYMVHEDRFPNKDRVPLIRSPLLVVHGQKDIMIPCRHGIELYGACRSRKLLVCPKDMEHNTNLLANVTYFVLPMLQFFSLPDYCFEDIQVPSWAYDKRLSPFHHNSSVPRSIVHLGSSHADSNSETPNNPTMGCLVCPAMQVGSSQDGETPREDSSTSAVFNRWIFGKKVAGTEACKQPWAVAAAAAMNGNTNGSRFCGTTHLQGPRTSAAIEKPGYKGAQVAKGSPKRGIPKVVPPPGAAEALPVPPPPQGAFSGPHPQPSPQAPLTPPPPMVSSVEMPVKSVPLAVQGHEWLDVQERTASRNRFQESAVIPTPPWRPSLAPNEPVVQSEHMALPSDPSSSLKLLTPVDLVEIVEDLERHFACEGEDKVALEVKTTISKATLSQVPPLSAPCSPAVKQWRSIPGEVTNGRRRTFGGEDGPIRIPLPAECKSPIETEWSV